MKAVFHRQEVLVWWLLSNGEHLDSNELEKALDIGRNPPALDKSENEPPTPLDIVEPRHKADFIQELLENPPPILADVADQDNDAFIQPPFDERNTNLQPHGTIVDFYRTNDKVDIHLKHEQVVEIIYKKGPEAIMANVRRRNDEARAHLHKRLNNNKHSSEDGNKKLPVKTGNERLTRPPAGPPLGEGPTDGQIKGKNLKTNFGFRWLHVPVNDVFGLQMALVEDLVTRTLCDAKKKEKEHRSLKRFLRQSWKELRAGGMKQYMKPQVVREVIGGGRQGNLTHDADPRGKTSECLEKHNTELPTAIPEGAQSEEYPDAGEDKDKRSPEPTAAQRRLGSMKEERVALYIPYLSLGEKELKTYAPSSKNMQSQSSDDLSRLLVHDTMTLDQYYYMALDDTDKRDSDQVLSRYLGEESKQILVVGDLWVWIIDETTIITATTDQSVNFVDIVLRKMAIRKGSEAVERPKSVESMMKLLLSILTELFTQHVRINKNETKSILDIFRASIRNVANRESESYDNFVKSVEKDAKADQTSLGQTSHYNIMEETKILREIKDIRDELNILVELAEDQHTVWSQVFSVDGHAFNVRTPSSVRDEIIEMSDEAKMVQDSIDSLLDLKQKQASIREAESGRRQAENTSKQSNTVMVFTVVTIIILPLSFLSSLFALNVSDYPHQDNNVLYQGWWIFPIIFGSSAAVSIPLVWIAFDVNSLLKAYDNLKRSEAWGSWKRRREAINKFANSNSSVQALVERVKRGSTSITSPDKTDLEPGLGKAPSGKDNILG